MNKQKEWRPLPDSITIKESTIEGLGVFATKYIQQTLILEYLTFMIKDFQIII